VRRRVVELLGRSRDDRLAAASVAIGLFGIVIVWLARPERGGDTGPLQTGTEALARCLAALDLVRCTGEGTMDPFPVLQHVPDMAGHLADISVDGRTRLLAALSAAGIAVAVAAAWIALRRIGLPEWRWGFLLVAVTGPTLAYGNTTWGEMLATGLVTLLVAAALVPARPGLVGLAAFGAGLTKETGYAFVAALGLLALLLARRRTSRPVRRRVLVGGAGLALAIAVGAGLNLIRYGTPRNAYYLDPGLLTTDVGKLLELGAGLFVAPNGGILVFWPLATILVALLIAVPVVRALRGAASWSEAWPSAALLVIVGGLALGLATWWAPFGWWAWGPRLSLPWVLPIVLVAVAAFGSALSPLLARALSPIARLVGASIVVAAAALPHVGLVWRPRAVGDFFFRAETAACPGGGPPPTQEYYDCLSERMWTRHPILLDALGGVGTPGGAVTIALVTLVVVGCLVRFRSEAAERLSTPHGR
jgi:hypothetical protein